LRPSDSTEHDRETRTLSQHGQDANGLTAQAGSHFAGGASILEHGIFVEAALAELAALNDLI